MKSFGYALAICGGIYCIFFAANIYHVIFIVAPSLIGGMYIVYKLNKEDYEHSRETWRTHSESEGGTS